MSPSDATPDPASTPPGGSTPDAPGGPAAPAGPTPRPARRRRWGRRLLVLLLLLVAAVATAPYWASPILRGMIAGQLDGRIAGGAHLDRFAFGWGDVDIGGLRLTDRDGRDVLEVASARATVALGPALGGRYVATLDMDGPRLVVQADESGTLNVTDVVPAAGDEPPGRERDEFPADRDGGPAAPEAPDVEARVRVTGGHLELRDAAGRATSLRDVTLSLDVASLARPATFSLSAAVHGPGGAAGAIRVDGETTVAPAGRLDPSALAGALRYALEDLALEALAPAAAVLAGVTRLSGRLAGDGDWTLEGFPALGGRSTVTLTDLVLEGPVPEMLTLPRAVLTADASVAAGGDERAFDGTGTVSLDVDPATGGLLADLLPVPLQVRLRHEGVLDLRPGGTSEIRRLEVRSPYLEIDASGSVVDLADPVAASGALTHETRVRTGELGELLDTFAPGTRVGGEDVVVSGRVDMADGTLTAPTVIDVPRLVARLPALGPEGLRLDGLLLDAEVRQDDRGLTTTGTLSGEAIDLSLPPAEDGTARRLAQRGLVVDFDTDLERGAGGPGPITLRRLDLATNTLTAGLSGTVGRPHDPAAMDASLRLTLAATLESLVAQLAVLAPLPDGLELSGGLDVDMDVTGDLAALAASGRTTVTNLHLALPSRQGLPLVLDDPRFEVRLDGTVRPEALEVELGELGLTSVLAEGTVAGRVAGLGTLADGAPDLRLDGITASLRWAPDRVAALLPPDLPVTLSGARPQPLELSLDARLRDLHPTAILTAAQATASLGLGTVQGFGFTVSGPVQAGLDKGVARASADLSANGGTLGLDATFDLRPDAAATGGRAGGGQGGAAADPGGAGEATGGDPASAAGDHEERVESLVGGLPTRLALTIDGLDASASAGPLLARLSPLLAQAVGGSEDVSLAGSLSGSLELGYGASLPLGGGSLAEAIDLTALCGGGRVDLGRAVVSAGSMFGELVGSGGGPRTFRLQPLAFSLDGGRLAYDEPWSWTVDGIDTTFSGSIGLDRTLDLAWSIPISDALIARYDDLEVLRGERISVPIAGTLTSPQPKLDGLLADLLERAARARLKQELDDRIDEELGDELDDLGGLGDKLGELLGRGGKGGDEGGGTTGGTGAGGDDPEGGEGGGSDDDPPAEDEPKTPAEILAKADTLWDAGKKKEARPYYVRLKDDFQLTLVYQLNKDRIKDRARWNPPKKP